MPITKDNKKLYMKNGNLPIEFINGLSSFIETGSTIKKIELPSDYSDGKFPNHSRDEEVKGSSITLSGNFSREGSNLKLDNGKYIILNIYPNVEPFHKWLNFTVKTSGSNNSVTLQIFNKNGEKLYDQTKVSSNEWLIEWDLNNLNLDLEELVFKLISNSSNIVVSNIFFKYDLNPIDVKNIFSEVNALTFNNKKSDFYASRIRSVTKKYSELVNGDYIIGYNHIGSISGKFVTINLESGDWISLDGYDFSHSENFEGAFNGSYVSSGMNTSEIDSCFTFEVQRQTPQDLINVKNELLSKIGDNLTIETYENGIRIKKGGTYVYSACWGSVDITTTGSNGTASTTVNYPFAFAGVRTSFASASTSSALQVAGSTQSTGVSSMGVTLQRSSAGTSPVRWLVIGD
ncbi:MAG: hypothetical protein ISP01_07335 [Methanobrevibacter arboriphilus]|uniref:Uncharacterized protein n=1 Tax=Methanobrevibacter arboriphilus TaxID=39441 RepID=A0A843AES1_METAZ|nr:hypothetical protein [Methanobrevibacter arboriphilus]MBF4469204.1 hypothetical protein [Methanobrevibacter arboriphilus]